MANSTISGLPDGTPTLAAYAVIDDGTTTFRVSLTALQALIGGGGGGGGTVGANNTPGYGAVVLAPAQMTTTQNDYTPTGFIVTLSALRLLPASGDTTMTGLAALTFGNYYSFIITNVATSDSIVFSHEDAGSLAANRFLCAGGVPAVLAPYDQLICTRDTTANRWRLT